MELACETLHKHLAKELGMTTIRGNVSTDDWEDQIEQLRSAIGAFSDQLRTDVDGSARVPNLEWTVVDLASHLASLPGLYRLQHEAGSNYELPERFSGFADRARAHISSTDPAELADLIESEMAQFIDELGGPDDVRWQWAQESKSRHTVALLHNEFIMHGQDLAAVTGARVPRHSEEQARRIVPAMFVTTPAFVDREKALAQPDGVYHVKMRGGADYTWTKQDARLSISDGKPTKADARLNADPIMFIMSSLGRVGQVRAALSGGVVAYGRKPQRFLGLGNVISDGI